MELDFNRIIQLKKIRMEKSLLSGKEMSLSEPLLTDRSFIKHIYDTFIEILNERDCKPRIDSVIQRKKFIFIVLYLYAPSVLAGGKMPKGLREDICKALDFHSASTISENCADVVFLYQNYPDFRNDINDLYDYIIGKIN